MECHAVTAESKAPISFCHKTAAGGNSDGFACQHGCMVITTLDPAIQSYAEHSGVHMNRHHSLVTTIQECFARALEEGDIIFHYQPVVDAVTGACLSSELLMRWKDGAGNLIAPGLYISAVEEDHDLMKRTGAYTIEKALSTYASWQRRDAAPSQISVNSSPVEVADPAYANTVLDALERHGVNPTHLQIELTEGRKLLNVAQSQASLMKLAVAGINIALDDFGEGYSSYTRLIKLPFHTIKLDRAAGQEYLASRNGMKLLARLIHYASQHNKDIIVEGIESPDQVDTLVRAGVSKIQGFVFSRPLPERDFLQYVRDHPHLNPPTRTVA